MDTIPYKDALNREIATHDEKKKSSSSRNIHCAYTHTHPDSCTYVNLSRDVSIPRYTCMYLKIIGVHYHTVIIVSINALGHGLTTTTDTTLHVSTYFEPVIYLLFFYYYSSPPPSRLFILFS